MRQFDSKVSQPFLLAFLGSIILSTIKLRVRFVEPLLWGEDGSDLFKVVFCEGKLGLLQPVVEQFMPLQRLISWLCFLISPYYFAELLTFFSLTIFSFCSAYIAKKTFRSLIRSDLLRIIFALLVPNCPGSFEILGNLTCLVYPLTWLLALVVLELAIVGTTLFRTIGAVLIVLVNPMAFTTLPLLLGLWRKISAPSKHLICAVIIGFLAFSIYRSSNLDLEASHLQVSRIPEVPKAVIGTLIGYSLLFSFLGESLTNLFLMQGSLTGIITGLTLLLFIVALAKQTLAEKSLLVLLWIVPITYAAAHAVCRDYSIDPFNLGMIPSNSRCLFFFFLPSALIVFCICGSASNNLNLKTILGLVPISFLLIAVLPEAIQGWKLNSERSDSSWSNFRSHLESSSQQGVWQSGFNIYPAEIREGKVYSWASMQVSKNLESISCKFKGGNTGDQIIEHVRELPSK